MRIIALITALLACAPVAGAPPAHAEAPTRSHGVSLLGAPALPPDFPYFPWVNPDAPKGGEVALGAVGTFDSLNPFIVRGRAAGAAGRIYDTLMVRNFDEAQTEYGNLAGVIEIPADHMGVAFELRPEARFHDGTPVTADDVVWSFNTLRDKGRPNYRQYYGDVTEAVVEGPRRVVFRFRTHANRELPMILGDLAVLPRRFWEGREFDRPLTDVPLGSGPYRIGKVDFGRSITLERVPDWWGRDLPVAKGLYNFDRIRTEYFRDGTVAMEAFKAGQIDYRSENIAKNWATAYDFPAVQKGLVRKESIRHRLPTGMQGWAMNTRRPLFQDRRVREALALAFDFEWANANLFYGEYTRTESYFSNSDLASSGTPQGAELALLDKWRGKLPPELFTQPFRLPVTDGSGNNREGLRRGLALLKEAGWTVKDRKLVDAQGRPFTFEILLSEPTFERVALPYKQWLSRLGIEASVRTVDAAQYQRRLDTYDYDMTMMVIPQSESPGNEQVGFWTCGAVNLEGGDNLMGVCDPVVDALVPQVVTAADRTQLLTTVHALDRVLLWGWYMVPNWHLQSVWIAYWDRFGRPSAPVRPGVVFDSWWVSPEKDTALQAARRAGP
ncbi:ABC transporter substrate-binding protein [Rhodovastum atsumiense]|uniref:ABC transporter substrate-binding protein n=1 Tax=Rhodovastum atsumiense TaxID=504468 RepID=A0A5M6IVU2_9PROT|nr:extracellular solute-binding protein [Rhodovastum atsumiense]KAA5612402.1 ABC transporter substrate-binding protein [Rhodovastum atsumiense]CAH2600308.1 ABC transporter substrate-binding protein [Rhodovastum atsumiense]